jgi:exodeoxyribonuclease-1
MTYIFYDTETTGLEPAFDQILQFAAIVTDDDFNVLEEVNLRCRLQPHVLPSPGAMFITKVGPKEIQAAPHSCYEMVCAIRKFIEKWSPAVLIGFNSIGYDEHMLRQAFYQNLYPTYQTNTNGNSRMDVLLLAHAVAAHKPDAIAVGTNDKGKPSFKLIHLIEANSLVLDQAHDALADTRATMVLAKYLKERAPEIWDALYACRSRKLVSDLLAESDLVLFTDRAFKKATILAAFICVSPDNPAAHAMFDLSYDPALFLDVDLERAQRLLKSNPRPIRILRANNLPIVRPYRDGDQTEINAVVARERLAAINAHPTFAATIAKALAGQYADQEPSPHIEEQIYGEFPSRADERLMGRFHQAPWPERYALAQGFEDNRYREFAERIIFAEHPQGLPEDRRSALADWCSSRLSTDDETSWMTFTKAAAKLESLRDEQTVVNPELFGEIETYLAGFKSEGRAA